MIISRVVTFVVWLAIAILSVPLGAQAQGTGKIARLGFISGSSPSTARDFVVQQPTTFELTLNMKSAEALGVTITPSLLLRVDQVIQ
jgi:hypothetical protein